MRSASERTAEKARPLLPVTPNSSDATSCGKSLAAHTDLGNASRLNEGLALPPPTPPLLLLLAESPLPPLLDDEEEEDFVLLLLSAFVSAAAAAVVAVAAVGARSDVRCKKKRSFSSSALTAKSSKNETVSMRSFLAKKGVPASSAPRTGRAEGLVASSRLYSRWSAAGMRPTSESACSLGIGPLKHS